MRFLTRLFSSLKLTVWTLTLLIAVFFTGAYVMPLYPKAHQGMNSAPLFEWWAQFGQHHVLVNFWLPLSLVFLTVLTINTLVCTVRALRLTSSLWAHITHAGFLLILLAHLVSSSTGFKEDQILLAKGFPKEIPKLGVKLELLDLNYTSYPGGMPKDYSATILFHTDKGENRASLGPNRPAFHRGIPVYLKNFGLQPVPHVLCEIVDDPGAPVALAGSILFLIGSLPLPFLVGRKRKDSLPGPEES